jgi:hypothetical protein
MQRALPRNPAPGPVYNNALKPESNLTMNDIRKPLEIEHNGLCISNFAGQLGSDSAPPDCWVWLYAQGFAEQARGPEAFTIFPQQAAREYDRAIYSGEVKNG